MRKVYEDAYGYEWTPEELKAHVLYDAQTAEEDEHEGCGIDRLIADRDFIFIGDEYCEDNGDGTASSTDYGHDYIQVVLSTYSDDGRHIEADEVGWIEVFSVLPDESAQIDRKYDTFSDELYNPGKLCLEADSPKALADMVPGDRLLIHLGVRCFLTAGTAGYTAVCFFDGEKGRDLDMNDTAMPMTFTYVIDNDLLYFLIKLPIGWYKLLAWPFFAPEIAVALRPREGSAFDKLHLILVDDITGMIKGVQDIVLREDFAKYFNNALLNFNRRGSIVEAYTKTYWDSRCVELGETHLSDVELAFKAKRRCGRDPDVAGPEESIW